MFGWLKKMFGGTTAGRPGDVYEIKALASRGLEGVPGLAKALRSGPEFDRRNIAEALGQIARDHRGDEGLKAAVPALGKLVKDHVFTYHVARALKHFGPLAESAIPDLLEAAASLDRPDGIGTAREVVHVLGAIGFPAVPALCQLVQRCSYVCGLAAWELGHFAREAESGAYHVLDPERHLVGLDSTVAVRLESTVEPLLSAIGNPDNEVREGMFYALGQVGHTKQVLDRLRAAADAEKDKIVRRKAWEAVKTLTKRMEDMDRKA